MGRVRTKTIKRSGRNIIENYYSRLSCDFEYNKRVTSLVASVPSKRLRNKIAGFITHTMKRLKKGSVRGICFNVRQIESERRSEALAEPEHVSNEGPLEVDGDTAALLKYLKVGFEYVKVQAPEAPRDRRR